MASYSRVSEPGVDDPRRPEIISIVPGSSVACVVSVTEIVFSKAMPVSCYAYGDGRDCGQQFSQVGFVAFVM